MQPTDMVLLATGMGFLILAIMIIIHEGSPDWR